uniref:Uncharacterized protein n=1 Tax=Lotharella globosa TaxID=91324 RepID=A0A7S3ZHW1_9EUKA
MILFMLSATRGRITTSDVHCLKVFLSSLFRHRCTISAATLLRSLGSVSLGCLQRMPRRRNGIPNRCAIVFNDSLSGQRTDDVDDHVAPLDGDVAVAGLSFVSLVVQSLVFPALSLVFLLLLGSLVFFGDAVGIVWLRLNTSLPT